MYIENDGGAPPDTSAAYSPSTAVIEPATSATPGGEASTAIAKRGGSNDQQTSDKRQRVITEVGFVRSGATLAATADAGELTKENRVLVSQLAQVRSDCIELKQKLAEKGRLLIAKDRMIAELKVHSTFAVPIDLQRSREGVCFSVRRVAILHSP